MLGVLFAARIDFCMFTVMQQNSSTLMAYMAAGVCYRAVALVLTSFQNSLPYVRMLSVRQTRDQRLDVPTQVSKGSGLLPDLATASMEAEQMDIRHASLFTFCIPCNATKCKCMATTKNAATVMWLPFRSLRTSERCDATSSSCQPSN